MSNNFASGPVCDTKDCENKRHAADRTGLCSQCKIDQGITKPKPIKQNETKAEVKMAFPNEHVDVRLIDKMFAIMASDNQPAVHNGLCTAWTSLPYQIKAQLMQAIADAALETINSTDEVLFETIQDNQALINDIRREEEAEEDTRGYSFIDPAHID